MSGGVYTLQSMNTHVREHFTYVCMCTCVTSLYKSAPPPLPIHYRRYVRMYVGVQHNNTITASHDM